MGRSPDNKVVAKGSRVNAVTAVSEVTKTCREGNGYTKCRHLSDVEQLAPKERDMEDTQKLNTTNNAINGDVEEDGPGGSNWSFGISGHVHAQRNWQTCFLRQ